MAKKTQVESTTSLSLGDYVLIKNFAGQVGRIAELRGPLGPGGVPVYRVKVAKKPRAAYIELLGDQIEYLPMTGQGIRMKRHKARAEDEDEEGRLTDFLRSSLSV